MTKSENLNPSNKESDLDLAGFRTPIEPVPNTDAASASSPSSGPQQFPAVFFVHEKITNSVRQVYLALVRLNAVRRTKTELLDLAAAMHPQAVLRCCCGSGQQAGEPAFWLAPGNLSDIH